MYRFLFIIPFLFFSLYGKKNLIISAENIKIKKNKLIAKKNIEIKFNKMKINTNYLFYDKNNSKIILKDKIQIQDEFNNKITSSRIEINTKNKNFIFKKVLLKRDFLWITAKRAEQKENIITFKDGNLSECNLKNPDWSFSFKKCFYNINTKSIKLENINFKLFNHKIFYLPFISFFQKRKVGLLTPYFAYSIQDGFTYKQPILLFLKKKWELEFAPIYRSNSGIGATSQLIFKDKKKSGKLQIGYFSNNKNYSEKYFLKKQYYGVNFLYKDLNLFPKVKNYKSTLYTNIFYANDIEYLSLYRKKNIDLNLKENTMNSRINSFIYDGFNYFGIYTKYYSSINTSVINNNILDAPIVHYHHSLDKFFNQNIFYSLDAKVNHIVKNGNYEGSQIKIFLPIKYHKNILNKYMNLSISQDIFSQKIFFNKFKNYYQNNINNIFEISSSLINRLDNNLTHIVNLSIKYIKPFIKKESFPYLNLSESQRHLFPEKKNNENIFFSFNQSLYNKNLSQKFYHKLDINVEDDNFEDKKLYNKLEFSKNNFKISNYIDFSLKNKKINSTLTDLEFSFNKNRISIIDFMSNETNNLFHFIKFKLFIEYNKQNSWSFDYDGDIKNNFNHRWKVSWKYSTKCWNTEIGFGEERIPNKINSFKNKKIFFKFNLFNYSS